ncbi:sulfate/thiosulfate import ATP-binding protein CysA [Andreesenia angusta]|uniref:Sulfate/thiosulfate import ATP-binding protein CysA n=1 Tax=Andreesenia angusta TaxID=39480 RepID=A0A1S1V9Q7_9FIRM|nr:ABC transporter ATP-binding protein [Andreesenia angusta]OHW63318.1 sulfate/thiosulfate import ATP-binding protein CysA [Andreesenia angusta]
MFSLRDVRYKDILEIDELEIEDGKVTSIVGESGSGKTTLLRLLNKLISCDSGEVKYRGENIENIDSVELRRNVVMLPQIPSIFSGTVRDNLQIGLKFSEKPEADDSVLLSVLELVGLKKSLDESSENLSGGEKQRLALGRVILLEPEVLLLDEPSSALDEETERIIIGKLVEYTKEQKKTLVMVTHSKKIAKNYSDNIIEIRNGRIAEEG